MVLLPFVIFLLILMPPLISAFIYSRRPSAALLTALIICNVIIGILLPTALVLGNNAYIRSQYISREDAQLTRTAVPQPTGFPTATPIPFAEVIIAVQDIPRGAEIQPNMVEVIAFPVNFLPSGTFSDLNSVIGRIARTDIPREMMILSRHILPVDTPNVYNDLARTIDEIQPLRPMLVRGTLDEGVAVTGEINNVNWIEQWYFIAAEAQTYTVVMERLEGSLLPSLLVWGNSQAIIGERIVTENSTTFTFALPEPMLISIQPTRARWNNGTTSGRYRLIINQGFSVED